MVRKALADGPQVVTRHGEEIAVVMSADEYRSLAGDKPDLREFLLSGPDLSALDLERQREMPRDIELGEPRREPPGS